MMELPTYTAVFRLKRRLYAIYDWELPVPVGLLEIAVFAAGVALCAVVAQLIGLELTPGSAWFFVVPPGFLAYAARRPLADGKPPHAWAWAQLRYLLEPRLLHGLADRPPRAVRTASTTTSGQQPDAAATTDEATATVPGAEDTETVVAGVGADHGSGP